MTDKDSRDIVRLEIIGIDIIYECATGVTNSCWQSNFWKETGGQHIFKEIVVMRFCIDF